MTLTPPDRKGVLANKTILSVSVGYYSTCVVANDKKAYCYGENG
jgi:hypothetical protein